MSAAGSRAPRTADAPAIDQPSGGWLEPLLSSSQMRALDRWAIDERGVPSLELMENAGNAVAERVAELEPPGPVRIVCGKGNNGGDGLVAARRLQALGLEAQALLLFDGGELSADARANLERLEQAGASAARVEAAELEAALGGSALVVDALLGTGFEGAPRPPLDRAIEAINDTETEVVVAVDVPSGLDASTGEVEGACVDADLTVTFHAAKVGQWLLPGKLRCGRVEVVDIGMPPGAPSASDCAGLIRAAVLELLPRRDAQSTKFSSGSVLVVGGSRGLTGAPCMACEAAMRAGAGWVRVAVPASLNAIFEQKLTETMSIPLADDDGALARAALDGVLEAAERADAVVLGPGLGRTAQAFELARELAARVERPLLVDADALNALAGSLDALADRPHATVLTPHAGELARLLETESSEVARRRLEHARVAAQRSAATVVLKGDDTIVTDGRERTAVSAGGAPALASAGTGDVLSGVVGAFMAKLDAFEAACAGVFAHSRAGWIAGAAQGPDSVIASDLIAALPAALRRPEEPEPA